MTAPGELSAFMRADHARLGELLDRAVARPGEVEPQAFASFREGLLRHIAREEKVLFPAVREARGEAVPEYRRLRVEHGAIAALLVPPPSPALVAEIRKILVPHDAVEEAPGGPYAACDALPDAARAELLRRLAAYPPVRVAPHRDGPRVCHTAEEALRVSALQASAR